MKSIKIIATTLILFIGAFSVSAECTLTSPCGTFVYDVSSLSVSSNYSNGVTTITVSSDGNVIDNITCEGSGGISTSCTNNDGGGNDDDNDGGGFNICDYLTDPYWKAFFGC